MYSSHHGWPWTRVAAGVGCQRGAGYDGTTGSGRGAVVESAVAENAVVESAVVESLGAASPAAVVGVQL